MFQLCWKRQNISYKIDGRNLLNYPRNLMFHQPSFLSKNGRFLGLFIAIKETSRVSNDKPSFYEPKNCATTNFAYRP